MPVFRETAEAVALPFHKSAWKASDRLGRLAALVPLSAFGMQIFDAGLKAFGKAPFFEGFMGPLGVETTPPANADSAQRIGEWAIAVTSLPYDTARLTSGLIGETGSMIATAPHLQWTERVGEVAESLAGAAVASALTGLALNLGIPNKPAPTPSAGK